MTNENIIAILLALIPAYFGWKQFEKRYLIDEKTTAINMNSSTSEEWQKLYLAAREEAEQTKKAFKELKEEFYEMKTDGQQLRIEFNSLKRNMQDEKKKLKELVRVQKDEIACLKVENIELKERLNFNQENMQGRD